MLMTQVITTSVSIIETYGKLVTFGIFIKSAVPVVQKNLKLGVVITWVISIVKRNTLCYSNMPRGSRPFDLGCGKGLYSAGAQWYYSNSVTLRHQRFRGNFRYYY